MSGVLIALGLVLAYLIHTYFFWRSGRKTEQTHDEETEEHRGADWSQGHATSAGFSQYVPP